MVTARLDVRRVETRFIASLTDRMATDAGRNAMAGLRPERVRRDESRLYVADFACGRGRVMISRGGSFLRAGRRGQAAKLTTP